MRGEKTWDSKTKYLNLIIIFNTNMFYVKKRKTKGLWLDLDNVNVA